MGSKLLHTLLYILFLTEIVKKRYNFKIEIMYSTHNFLYSPIFGEWAVGSGMAGGWDFRAPSSIEFGTPSLISQPLVLATYNSTPDLSSTVYLISSILST